MTFFFTRRFDEIRFVTLKVSSIMNEKWYDFWLIDDFPILAVFMAEVVKLVVCLFLVYLEEGSSMIRLKASLINTIIKNKTDTVSAYRNVLNSGRVPTFLLFFIIITSAQNDRTIFNLWWVITCISHHDSCKLMRFSIILQFSKTISSTCQRPISMRQHIKWLINWKFWLLHYLQVRDNVVIQFQLQLSAKQIVSLVLIICSHNAP